MTLKPQNPLVKGRKPLTWYKTDYKARMAAIVPPLVVLIPYALPALWSDAPPPEMDADEMSQAIWDLTKVLALALLGSFVAYAIVWRKQDYEITDEE